MSRAKKSEESGFDASPWDRVRENRARKRRRRKKAKRHEIRVVNERPGERSFLERWLVTPWDDVNTSQRGGDLYIDPYLPIIFDSSNRRVSQLILFHLHLFSHVIFLLSLPHVFTRSLYSTAWSRYEKGKSRVRDRGKERNRHGYR